MRSALSIAIAFFASLAIASAPVTPRPGELLIGRLKRLADSGRMTDATFVARTLGMAFTAREQFFDPTPVPCAAGLTTRPWRTVVRRPDATTALRPTSFGLARMTRAGFGFINSKPAEISVVSQFQINR